MHYIRIAQLASTRTRAGRWPVAPSTVWRWVERGILPPPIALGPGVSAWPLPVIEAHEAAAAAAAATDAAAQLRAAAASVATRTAREVAA